MLKNMMIMMMMNNSKKMKAKEKMKKKKKKKRKRKKNNNNNNNNTSFKLTSQFTRIRSKRNTRFCKEKVTDEMKTKNSIHIIIFLQT